MLNDPVNLVDPEGKDWDTALTIGGAIAGGLLGGGASMGIGTAMGAAAGAGFGHALGGWIDYMLEQPQYPLGDPRRNKQMQDIADRTRKMGKKTTKSVCKLGTVGKF